VKNKASCPLKYLQFILAPGGIFEFAGETLSSCTRDVLTIILLSSFFEGNVKGVLFSRRSGYIDVAERFMGFCQA
jgi:hypothetical protein